MGSCRSLWQWPPGEGHLVAAHVAIQIEMRQAEGHSQRPELLNRTLNAIGNLGSLRAFGLIWLRILEIDTDCDACGSLVRGDRVGAEFNARASQA